MFERKKSPLAFFRKGFADHADFLLTNFQREGVSADPFGDVIRCRFCAAMEILAISIVALSVDKVADADVFPFHFRACWLMFGNGTSTKELAVVFTFFENVFAD